MSNAIREFLDLCEYTPDEIDKGLTRVKTVFDRCMLSEEKIKRGIERAKKYYQCDMYKGMRLFLGATLRQFIDMSLSKDEGKLRLYSELPQALIAPFLAAGTYVGSEITTGSPSMLYMHLVGGIFDNHDPVLEWSEERCLPPGESHCGCNMTKIGVRGLGIIPPAQLSYSSGVYCDEAPKADEACSILFGDNVFYLNRCQDEGMFEAPGPERAVTYFTEGHELLRQEVSKIVGAEITDEMLKQSLRCYLEELAIQSTIGEIRAFADPQPLYAAAYNFIWQLTVYNPGVVLHERRMEALQTLHDEVQGMIDRGEGVLEKGAPRVMYVPVAPITGLSYVRVLEDAGINLAAQEFFASNLVDVEELNSMMEAMPATMLYSLMWLMSPLAYMNSRIGVIQEGFKKGNLDGIILFALYSCRILGSEMMMLKDGLRKELGPEVPITLLDYDLFDKRNFNSRQARVRLESFAEMVKAGKGC